MSITHSIVSMAQASRVNVRMRICGVRTSIVFSESACDAKPWKSHPR